MTCIASAYQCILIYDLIVHRAKSTHRSLNASFAYCRLVHLYRLLPSTTTTINSIKFNQINAFKLPTRSDVFLAILRKHWHWIECKYLQWSPWSSWSDHWSSITIENTQPVRHRCNAVFNRNHLFDRMLAVILLRVLNIWSNVLKMSQKKKKRWTYSKHIHSQTHTQRHGKKADLSEFAYKLKLRNTVLKLRFFAR